jgi:hypothetical protein
MAVNDDRLAILEERVERGLFRDWRETGEALEQIRDEKLYRPQYPSFRAYVEGRYEMHRGTAYGFIQAADVMRDLSSRDDTPNLPQRHAQLLYRFDTETRVEVAREIALLSFREASLVVIERAATATPSFANPEDDIERDAELELLDYALRAILGLNEQRLRERLDGIDAKSRHKLDRSISEAIRRLGNARNV